MPDSAEQALLEQMHRIVNQNVSEPVAIAFSGGVDSSLMAQLCSRIRKGNVLLTVGFENSHDMAYAESVSHIFDMSHYTHTITNAELAELSEDPRFEFESLSWQENCIAFYFVSHLAHARGIDTVLTANGIDELFCGYDLYRRMYAAGEDAILAMIHDKTSAEMAMMQEIQRVADCNGVQMVQPLLQSEFVDYARTVPLYEKIRGKDDYTRKHVVRRAARLSGLPHSVCWKRKKALQYGSGIHRNLIKIRKRHSLRRFV